MTSKTIATIVSAGLIVLASFATAQTAGHSQTRPLDQAIESVDGNLAKDPNNPGLKRASQQLRYNQIRIEAQRADRPDLPVRPERPALPDRPQRPLR